MSHLQRQVNLTIVQDWNKTRQVYQKIKQKIDNGELEKTATQGGYHEKDVAKDYAMPGSGKMTVTHGWSKDWNFWHGPLLYATFPWYKQAVEYFSGLNLSSIMWVVSREAIVNHIDMKDIHDPVNTDPDDPPQCKLTYIVSSEDPDAKTVSYDINNPGIRASYPSIPNTAWLLATGHPHEVVARPGLREILQFKFDNTYQEVSDYLDKKGPVHFE